MLKKLFLSIFIFFIGFGFVYGNTTTLNIPASVGGNVNPVIQFNNPNNNTLVNQAINNADKKAAAEAWKNDATNMQSTSFMFPVGDLSPTQKQYVSEKGGGDNIKPLLALITRTLVIILPTISVLLMVAGGIMIIVSGGASEKVTKGKNIIIYNIVAIIISLFSYTIIKLVIWILGSNAF